MNSKGVPEPVTLPGSFEPVAADAARALSHGSRGFFYHRE
jgi:hypothetical protein